MFVEVLVRHMLKLELHVHLEGSIRPETLLKLARRNGVSLPADSVEGLKEWYQFRDFKHFVEIYVAASSCIKNAGDIELIANEFVDAQMAQNIIYSEITYTAETIERFGIPWPEQLAALRRADEYARSKGATIFWIIDIVRELSADRGLKVADWAIEAGAALGLSGVEAETPASRHREAFRRAKDAGLKISTHAGETSGPDAIWECLEVLGADRIGHGVRCLEDPKLVEKLISDQTPLEVCPSSNVCLGVSSSFAEHPIGRMVDLGLNVSVNSDDPPMFNTTLTQEWEKCVRTFGWSEEQVRQIMARTADAAFLPASKD